MGAHIYICRFDDIEAWINGSAPNIKDGVRLKPGKRMRRLLIDMDNTWRRHRGVVGSLEHTVHIEAEGSWSEDRHLIESLCVPDDVALFIPVNSGKVEVYGYQNSIRCSSPSVQVHYGTDSYRAVFEFTAFNQSVGMVYFAGDFVAETESIPEQ